MSPAPRWIEPIIGSFTDVSMRNIDFRSRSPWCGSAVGRTSSSEESADRKAVASSNGDDSDDPR